MVSRLPPRVAANSSHARGRPRRRPPAQPSAQRRMPEPFQPKDSGRSPVRSQSSSTPISSLCRRRCCTGGGVAVAVVACAAETKTQALMFDPSLKGSWCISCIRIIQPLCLVPTSRKQVCLLAGPRWSGRSRDQKPASVPQGAAEVHENYSRAPRPVPACAEVNEVNLERVPRPPSVEKCPFPQRELQRVKERERLRAAELNPQHPGDSRSDDPTSCASSWSPRAA